MGHLAHFVCPCLGHLRELIELIVRAKKTPVMMTLLRTALLLRTVAEAFDVSPHVKTSRMARACVSRPFCLRATTRCVASDTKPAVSDEDVDPIRWTDAMQLPNNDDNGKLLRIRHSTAHVMAMAVQK